MPYPAVDLSRVRTYPVVLRHSLVVLNDFITPDAPVPPFENPELAEVAGFDVVWVPQEPDPPGEHLWPTESR